MKSGKDKKIEPSRQTAENSGHASWSTPGGLAYGLFLLCQITGWIATVALEFRVEYLFFDL